MNGAEISARGEAPTLDERLRRLFGGENGEGTTLLERLSRRFGRTSQRSDGVSPGPAPLMTCQDLADRKTGTKHTPFLSNRASAGVCPPLDHASSDHYKSSPVPHGMPSVHPKTVPASMEPRPVAIESDSSSILQRRGLCASIP